jgi:cytochrome P450
MVDNIKHISDNWQDNTTIDVLQEMTMLAMGVMTESLFGINFRDRDTFSKVSDSFTNILESFTQVHEPVESILTDKEPTNIENKKQNKFQDSIDYLNQKIYTLIDHIKNTNPEKPTINCINMVIGLSCNKSRDSR